MAVNGGSGGCDERKGGEVKGDRRRAGEAEKEGRTREKG